MKVIRLVRPALIVWAVVGAACAASALQQVEDKLIEPVAHYMETLDAATARLDFHHYSLGSSIIFDVTEASQGVPPLELQGRLLDVLLGRLLRDHPDITSLYVGLGANREALLEPLDKLLLHSPEWNSARGLNRHGRLGAFLTEKINSSGIAAPLAAAFRAHGMQLSLTGVGRVDIEKVPGMHGARLPVHIDEMHFNAVKIGK